LRSNFEKGHQFDDLFFYIYGNNELNLNMKNFKIFYLFLFAVTISCNSVDPEPDVEDPLDIQANLLNGTWILKDASSAVKDGNIIPDFKDITLTFSGATKDGGNYSTTNSIDLDVWPNSGSWQFQNNDQRKLLRSDNVALSISVTQTTLRISFTIIGGLKEGNWVFDFIKQ
tara:strand:+ start:2595 stop:3107 length:513 start_codon:yes stop_codon:yes gene_type:complete